MRRGEGIILGLLLVAPASGAPTLGELCRAALGRAEESRSADARAAVAAHRSDEARGALLPKVSVEAGVTGWSEPTGSAGNAFLPGPLRPDHQSVLSLGVEQPVFAGGALVNRWREGRRAASAAEAGRRSSREAVLRATGDYAYLLLESREALRQAESSIERRRAHLKAARQRSSAGLAARAETARAEADVQAALASRIEAERAGIEARERLKALTGVDVSSGLAEPQPLAVPAEAGAETSANPELLAAHERAEAARSAWRGAQGDLLPQIVIGGQVRRTEESPQSILYIRNETFGYARLRWPLFAGGSRAAAVGEARSALEESREEEKRLARDRSADAVIAREAVRQAEAEVEAERARVEAARAAYDAAKERYGTGLESWLIRLDAESELTDAGAALARSRYARERAVLELHAARGTLETALLP